MSNILLFLSLVIVAGQIACVPDSNCEVVGELEVFIHDDFENGSSKETFMIKSGEGERVSLPTALMHEHYPNTRNGRFITNRCRNDYLEKVGESRANFELNNLSEIRTLVVLMNFNNTSAPEFTLEETEDILFSQVGDWLYEDSFSKRRLVPYDNLNPVFDLRNGEISIAAPNTIVPAMNAMVQALDDSVDFSKVDLAYIIGPFSHNYGGLAAYNPLSYSTNDGNVSFSAATARSMPANTYWHRSAFISTMVHISAHEISHTLGAGHAYNLKCAPGVSIATSYGSCQITENDWHSVMAPISNYHLPAQHHLIHKLRMGSLSPNQVPWVENDGSYTINPLADANSQTHGLRIARGFNGPRSNLFLEYRQDIASDTYLSAASSNVFSGLMIRTEEPNGKDTGLLDASLSASESFDLATAALTPEDAEFIDPYSGLSVKVTSADADAITVTIQNLPTIVHEFDGGPPQEDDGAGIVGDSDSIHSDTDFNGGDSEPFGDIGQEPYREDDESGGCFSTSGDNSRLLSLFIVIAFWYRRRQIGRD